MATLRLSSLLGGILGSAALVYSVVRALLLPGTPDSWWLWLLVAVLNLAPASGVFLSGMLDALPRRRAVTLFLAWAASSAPVLLLDVVVLVLMKAAP